MFTRLNEILLDATDVDLVNESDGFRDRFPFGEVLFYRSNKVQAGSRQRMDA